jgi:hypothetical protein
VVILKRMWTDERHRGPFVASLPVGGRDGTLSSRMSDPVLARRVQAKTGTIANVRALSGYLDAESGDKLVFSIIANHFTASSREVDAVVEEMLRRIVSGFQVPGSRVPGSLDFGLTGLRDLSMPATRRISSRYETPAIHASVDGRARGSCVAAGAAGGWAGCWSGC